MTDGGLSVVLGLASFVVLNVGMGVQKQGVEAFSDLRRNRRLLLIWLAGTAMTTVAVALQFKALELGRASLIASFGGVGLASLVIYSACVLREPIGREELVGITLIGLGTAVAGWFGGNERAAAMSLQALTSYGLLVGLATAAATLWVWQSRQELVGLVLAVASGVLGGLAVMVQKVVSTRSADGASGLVEQATRMAGDPLLWFFVLLTTAAFVVMQLSFRRDRAVVTVAAYTCASILVPVLGAPWVFSEDLTAPLVSGLAMLLGGVWVMVQGTMELLPEAT